MAVDVRLALLWLCSLVCHIVALTLVDVKELPQGNAEVSWITDSPDNMAFSILYGMGEEGVGLPPLEWHDIDNLPCCKAIISHLQARTVYTFKVVVSVGNKYMLSPPRVILIHEGVPPPPGDVSVKVHMEPTHNKSRNLSACVVAVVTWTEVDPADVEYYNVSLVIFSVRNDVSQRVLEKQTSHTYVTFEEIPNNTSFDVHVTAVNPHGRSRRVTAHHDAQVVSVGTHGPSSETGSRPFWVVLVPIMALFVLVAVIAMGIRWKRRRSHLNFLLHSKPDNGLSYMPLRLSPEQPGYHRLGGKPNRASGFGGRGGAESLSTHIHRASPLQGRRSEVNGIGHPCETSPHKVQFQLVSESPHQLARRVHSSETSGVRGVSLELTECTTADNTSAIISPQLDLLMSTPTGSPRSSKRTPIIPLSEEKLLSRVTTDPSRYPS